jgi:hypothetical protein
VWALLGLVVLWAALDHRLNREDGRWYAVATLGAAAHQLFGEALAGRVPDDAAFVGSWALALWGLTAMTAALAAGLWRSGDGSTGDATIGKVLWVVAGVLLLFGITGEIRRYFDLQPMAGETASLAAGVAVSAWWLIFAATLVAVGFRQALKPVRVAGLCVAGLAVVKVLLYDLASLDALYRVGSVFILGLVSLLLAYLYHRQGRAQQPGAPESVP